MEDVEMENKSSTIITKVEPSTKKQAEEICEDLGITLSSAINIFLKKMVQEDGLPFEMKRDRKGPINMDSLTREQLNKELEKGYENYLNGEGKEANEFFEEFRKKNGF